MRALILALALAACTGAIDPVAPTVRPVRASALVAPTGVTAQITACNSKFATVLVSYTITDPATDVFRASFNTPGTHDLAGMWTGNFATSPAFPPTSSLYAYVRFGTWDLYVEGGQLIDSTNGFYDWSANSDKVTVAVRHPDCPK